MPETNLNEQDKYRYYAFVSYKREDEEWAKWLQHKLEHYKLPSNLNGRTDLPKEIRPIFKDTSELNPGNLPQQIHDALEQSRYLIVICSPRSANSEWVNREVETFIDMGRTDKIIPFIIEGSAFSKNPDKECFPQALRNLPAEKEILGANINEMGRDAAAVKVVAQMFGLRFDELWQRYEREKRRKRTFVFAGITLLLLAAIFITSWIRKQRKEIQEEKWTKMENESKYVSGMANELTDKGLSFGAQYLLLRVLPADLCSPDFPYTPEAEKALRYAIMNNTIPIGDAFDVEYSPDGKRILMVKSDTIQILDMEKGGSPRFLSCIRSAIVARYSPDGKRIVVGSTNIFDKKLDEEVKGFVQLIDAETGMEIQTMETLGEVFSVAFSPEGKRVVSVSDNSHGLTKGLLQIWEVETGKELLRKERPYSFEVARDVAQFSPDGQRILTFFHDTVSVIDAQTGKVRLALEMEDKSDVSYACYSPDGNKIVSCSHDGQLTFWDAKTGRMLTTEKNEKPFWSSSIAFDGVAKQMVVASFDLKIVDSLGATHRVLGSEFCDDGYSKVKFSPDGRYLLTIYEDGYTGFHGDVKMWSVGDSVCIIDGLDSGRPPISFSPDGKQILPTSFENLRIFSPDGKSVISLLSVEGDGSLPTPINIKDVSTGELIRQLVGHGASVDYAEFSPDGKWIVSVSSYEGLVKVWDVESGGEIASFDGYAATFSPDCRKLALAMPGNKIRIIPFLPLQDLINQTRERFKDHPLTHEERRMCGLK